MRLLIVEDEVIIAKDLEQQLRRWGYEVIGLAVSSEEALQLAVSLQPDLILMDIQLDGGLDGIETASLIYQHIDIPVIYLTAHSDERSLERAKPTRPFGYLVKPVDFPTLRASIEMAVYTHSIRQQLAERALQHKAILSTALDGFMLIDETTCLRDVNDALCSMLGYTRDEMLNLTFADLEDIKTPAELESHVQMIRKNGADRFETRHRRKDGTTVEIDISIVYSAETKSFFAFVHDITPRKNNQQRILQLNSDLTQQLKENVRLYQEERKQRELAETLVKASEALATSLDANIVLDLILEQIGRIIQNDVCNIMMIDDDENSITVRSCGYDTFNADVFIETFIFPLSGLSIRNEIINTGKAVVVPDVSDDPRWTKAGAAWLRSYIAAPIIVQKKVIGFINVGSSLPDAYGEQQAIHLQTFAHQAAVAFQNARFFEEAQKNAARLQALSHQLINIQETERRYIARELHDEIGQALTAANMILQGAQASTDITLIHTRLNDSLAILNLALQQTRKISLDLHPSLLDDLGLVPALRWYADREATWSNFKVQVQAKEIDNLSDDLKLVCFRVTQEALTNISRHAQAKNVVIKLWQRGENIHLSVHDDGQGFDVQEALDGAAKGQSLGLLGMKERALLVGGEIEIDSSPQHGAEIRATFPIGE